MSPLLINDFGCRSANGVIPAQTSGKNDQHDRPASLSNTLVWSDALSTGEDNYTCYLTQKDIAEVEDALLYFKNLGLAGHEVCQDNFPLPALQHKLFHFARDLYDGQGFLNLRGLNAVDYSMEDNILIFFGISSYVAERRGRQDHRGNMLLHLQNSKTMNIAQHERPARDSNTSLQFHTDLWTDVLAMQVLKNAFRGGRHILSPAYKVYNELSRDRPDLLELLMQPIWTFDKNSLHYTPEPRPLIFWYDGRILFNFGRLQVLGDVDVPKLDLSEEKLEAFEILQTTAEKYQLRLESEPGDLIFINNFAVLHCRESFEDSEQQSRHLVRMWLKNESLAWQLPPVLKQGNDAVFYDNGDTGAWEILPKPRLYFDVRDKFTP